MYTPQTVCIGCEGTEFLPIEYYRDRYVTIPLTPEQEEANREEQAGIDAIAAYKAQEEANAAAQQITIDQNAQRIRDLDWVAGEEAKILSNQAIPEKTEINPVLPIVVGIAGLLFLFLTLSGDGSHGKRV